MAASKRSFRSDLLRSYGDFCGLIVEVLSAPSWWRIIATSTLSFDGTLPLALTFLEKSFLGTDGNILNRDVFGLTVEDSLLLDPLRGEPEFSDWLVRYQGRKQAMQEHMQNLESRGEIISVATAERMVTP